MDKSLKKLSRIELLELMVSLSQDYETLAAENAKLKKMLSQQRLPRSTKVGSIAEAALQANGYFEAAQRAADEYLREIKHLRDELAIKAGVVNQSPEERAASMRAADRGIQGSPGSSEDQARASSQQQAMLRDAKVQANNIVARANAQANAIMADARNRSEEVIAAANRQSHAMLSQANRQAESIRASARQTAIGSAQAQAPRMQRGDVALQGQRGRHGRIENGGRA